VSIEGLLLSWGAYANGQDIHIYDGDLTVHGNITAYAKVTELGLADNVVLTAADIANGYYGYDCGGSDRILTTPTAALMWANFKFAEPYTSFTFMVENTSDGLEKLVLTAGVGVTLSVDDVNIYPGQCKVYKVVLVSATAATIYELANNRPLTAGFVRYDNPIAAETVSIVAQENIADGARTLTGTDPDYPRTLQIKVTDANSSITAGTITVVGVDQNGVTQTEVIEPGSGNWNDTFDTTHAYCTVTSITVADLAGHDVGVDKIEVGVGDMFGLPTRPGGMLVGMSKVNEDDAGATPGALVEEYSQSAPPNASNAAMDFSFWYTFV